MILASWTSAAPTLAWAIAGAIAAVFLLTLQPRRLPVFRERFVRLAMLGRPAGQLSAIAAGWATASACVVAYVAIACRQPWAAAAIAGVSLWGFGWLLALLIERDERTLRNQLADFSIGMAGSVRAGLAPAEAIGRTTSDCPHPLAAIERRVFEDYQRGTTIRDSLGAARERVQLDAFNLFAAAIGMTIERGGRLDEALERISTSIHDQQRLEDKLHALTASGRSAMVVLGLFPFAFAAFFYSVDPTGYRVLLEQPIGQASVGAAIAVVFLAMRWAKAILDEVG